MLHQLSIQNYAIIDELEISFSGKFNAITGETGAGKSIIVGALGLILGQRADSSLLLNKEKKLVVEGQFSSANNRSISQFLKTNELDEADELLLRREIGVNGKSRAFINDTPVNLSQLQELSTLLVDLHQQFDTLEVGETNFQREVLDALASQLNIVDEFDGVYAEYVQNNSQLEDLWQRKKKFQSEYEYNKFQLEELEEAGFKENELEELDAEIKLLSNAEGIQQTLNKASSALQEGDEPLLSRLKSLLNDLQHYSNVHPDLPAISSRLQSSYIEIQDIAREIERLSAQVQYDPAKMERLSERLSLGYRLQKKHGVQSTEELLKVQEVISQKLQAVLDIDDAIEHAEIKAKELKNKAEKLAQKISAGRKKQVKPLEEQVNQLLVRVGMPSAKLKVNIDAVPLSKSGIDKVEFLFDANKSGQFQPLRKVASGGELSRLMLCIKSLVAASIDLEAMIFDEIDTGISGEAAKQVGIIMGELAANRQIICITHQPQIAGKANTHFLVYKQSGKSSDAPIRTSIREIKADERVEVIAKMLSGEKPTAAALANAKEMLQCG
jgi:DNA repair protein RecN (Recombination protein N)